MKTMKALDMLEIKGMIELWQEVQRLTKEVRFTAGQGCFLQGEQVCVVADMEPEEEGEGFRAGIIVFPLVSQPGSVEGWPVTLVGKTAFGGVLRHGQTNRRGDVIFHQLPEGEYSLRFPLVWGRSEEPVVEVSHTWRELAARTTAAEDLKRLRHAAKTTAAEDLAALDLAAQRRAVRTRGASRTAAEDLADLPLAAATEREEESAPPAPKVYPSGDGALLGTVRRTLSDELEVAFETKQADLAGAKVWFAFVEPETQRLLMEAEVTLEDTEEPGVWEGIWKSEPGFRLEAEGELVFEVTGSGS